MLSKIVSFDIQNAPPPRLDKAIARDVPQDASLSRSRLAKLITQGAVALNGHVVTDPRHRASEGDAIEVTIEEAVESHMTGEDIPLDILYEDDDLIVVNKPAGMVVHPAPGTPSGTLVNALLHHCGETLSGVGGAKRPGIVHRIDKDTSGALVVAKSDAAHNGLAAQFAKHTVGRRYLALCYGVPDATDPRLRGIRGTSFEAGNILRVQTHLARHRTDRQKQAVFFDTGRHAVTRVRIVDPLGHPAAVSVIECWLETGRTHQIRVHMAHCGHGLIGDPVYGGKRKLSATAVTEAGQTAVAGFSRQALHAATLSFWHPVQERDMEFAAPLPGDMRDLISALGGTNS